MQKGWWKPPWVWRVLANVSSMGMDVCWITLWYTVLAGTHTNALLNGLVFFIILLGNHLLLVMLEKANISITIGRIALAATFLAAAGISQVLFFKPGTFLWMMNEEGEQVLNLLRLFVHLGTMLLLVRRAGNITYSAPELLPALKSFQLGTLAMLLFEWLHSSVFPIHVNGSLLFGFLFLGIFSTAVSQVVETSTNPGGRQVRFDSPVTPALFLLTLLIFILAVFGSRIMVGDLPGTITSAIGKTFLAIAAWMKGWLQPLFEAFMAWFREFTIWDLPFIKPEFLFSEPPSSPGTIQLLLGANPGDQELKREGSVLWEILRITLVALAVVGASFVVMRFLRKNIERLSSPDEGAESSIRVGFQPLNLLDRIINTRERQKTSLQQWWGSMQVLRIYGQMMKLCDEIGQPRQAASTPLEFLPVLQALFSNAVDEVQLITHAFNRVRYGELPESSEEVRIVRQAWHQVRRSAPNAEKPKIKR